MYRDGLWRVFWVEKVLRFVRFYVLGLMAMGNDIRELRMLYVLGWAGMEAWMVE